MDREDWGSLAAFAIVAEERSFTRAAARLGVSPSALSHTLRRLEERLRIKLLARSTRSVSTTEAGERLLARLRPAIEEISKAVEDLGRLLDRPSGLLRITASRSAARMVVAPILHRFTQSYPEIVVEILVDRCSDQHRRAAVRRRHSPWRVPREGRGGRAGDGTASDGRRGVSAILQRHIRHRQRLMTSVNTAASISGCPRPARSTNGSSRKHTAAWRWGGRATHLRR